MTAYGKATSSRPLRNYSHLNRIDVGVRCRQIEAFEYLWLHPKVYGALHARGIVMPYLVFVLDLADSQLFGFGLSGDMIDSFKRFDLYEHEVSKGIMGFMQWPQDFVHSI